MEYIAKPTKLKIYVNTGCKTMAQIKAETGCDALINGGLYIMSTFKPVCHLKAGGKVLAYDEYKYWGYGWTDGFPKLIQDYSEVDNYICCVCLVRNSKAEQLIYPTDMGGARPRTAFGTFADGRIWMYASQTPITPEQLQTLALLAGVQDAVMMDGGGSTQGIFPDETVTSSRIVHNFICVWEEETKGESTMTANELARKAKDVAQNYKTSYIWGGIGRPITEENIQIAITQYSKNNNYAADARRYVNQPNAFYFDCVGLIKSLLWGWVGDNKKTYGGAIYASNNVPDISADQMIGVCSAVSTNFSNIEVGEVVWMTGHIGVYIGDGLAVECTPSWNNGVQITAVGNIGTKAGYKTRKWTKHGKLPYVTYSGNVETNKTQVGGSKVTVSLNVLKNGATGENVKALQILLNGRGYSCGTADGIFGAKTQAAVRSFQNRNKLEVDGVVGAATWKALLN